MRLIKSRRNVGNHVGVAGSRELTLMVFGFFLLINFASAGGHFDWVDGTEAFLVTESMVLKHSAMIYPDIPSVKTLHYEIHYLMPIDKALETGKPYNPDIPIGPFYSLRSLLLSAIAVPFYYVGNFFSASPIAVVGLLVESLLISLTSVVIFAFSLEIYASKGIAFILALIFSVCSFVWPYNTTFWSMPLQALCLISSAYFIYLSRHHHYSFICNYSRQDTYRNKAVYIAGFGGLFLGLSVFAHPTSIVIIPGILVYAIFSMRHNRKNLCSFFIALAITLSFMGLVNYWRFGSFTQFGYGYFSSILEHNGWHGLVGLLISPGAGLIFFFPLVVLFPLAMKYMYSRNKGFFYLSAYIVIVTWLYYGTLSYWEPFAWSGGVAWGPRYLIALLPFMTMVFGALLLRVKKGRFKNRLYLKTLVILVIVLCIAGFFINLVGKLVWFMYGLMYAWGVDHLRNTDWSMIMLWNPYYSPIFVHSKIMMQNYVSQIHPDKYANSAWYWTGYGLAPCSYDDYFYCRFGIAPIVFLCAAIAILGMAIIKEITGMRPGHMLSSFYILRTAKVKEENT